MYGNAAPAESRSHTAGNGNGLLKFTWMSSLLRSSLWSSSKKRKRKSDLMRQRRPDVCDSKARKDDLLKMLAQEAKRGNLVMRSQC